MDFWLVESVSSMFHFDLFDLILFDFDFDFDFEIFTLLDVAPPLTLVLCAVI